MQYAHFSAHLFQHGHCRFWKSQEESECHLLSISLSALMPSESQFIPRIVSFPQYLQSISVPRPVSQKPSPLLHTLLLFSQNEETSWFYIFYAASGNKWFKDVKIGASVTWGIDLDISFFIICWDWWNWFFWTVPCRSDVFVYLYL